MWKADCQSLIKAYENRWSRMNNQINNDSLLHAIKLYSQSESMCHISGNQ